MSSETIDWIFGFSMTYPAADATFPDILTNDSQTLRSNAQTVIQELPEPNQLVALACCVGPIALLRQRKVSVIYNSVIALVTTIAVVVFFRSDSKAASATIGVLCFLDLLVAAVNWWRKSH